MTLSALIRKREIATATVATPATHRGVEGRIVAKVASVAVANQLLAEEELAIRAWLAHINETDLVIITDVITTCQSSTEARAYCLEQAQQVPPESEPDYTVTCGACRHFQRIDHTNLGHCAQGEPEALAGLWDISLRWCIKYEVIEHG